MPEHGNFTCMNLQRHVLIASTSCVSVLCRNSDRKYINFHIRFEKPKQPFNCF